MFEKILVANRGEIAIRAFRAAYELGARTVAVFPYEDRNSLHRLKADEAYRIGEEGHPVRAYLDVDEIIRVAVESGADAIYPGYGFLSENPDLAAKAAANGITFIGPNSRALEMAGNKVTAKEHAIAAGVPVLRSTEATDDIDALVAQAEDIGFPVFAKAVAGGGGRGMRRVDSLEELAPALEAAMREADSAFGDPRMFLEQAVVRPRHIEVQILADKQGSTVHLFERDCSVQRRHQKVVEIAPAPNLEQSVREDLYRHAVAFAESIDYQNAGTVEFLLETAGERAGEVVFIEMNPRIQVEHTVTEEVTDVDLVGSQMRIAAGASLEDLGLTQDRIHLHGAAMQTRITTEDPTQGFRPDTGKITTYRSPGGSGIRIDGGTTAAGSEISPHFDSMLAKLDLPRPGLRHRGLARAPCTGGVPHPRRRHQHPVPAGRARGRRFHRRRCVDRVHRRATGSAARARVEGPRDQAAHLVGRHDGEQAQRRQPARLFSRFEAAGHRPERGGACRIEAATARTRPRGLRGGAARADTACRHRDHLPRCAPVAARDARAHPRPRGRGAARRADGAGAAVWSKRGEARPTMSHCASSARIRGSDWPCLREALPNVAIQMLLRGRNTVGYTPYPTEVTDAFVREAADTGI